MSPRTRNACNWGAVLAVWFFCLAMLQTLGVL